MRVAKAGWIAATVLLLATPPAGAASRDAKERAARTACLSGDYAKGITLLSELFVASEDPTYIYNQGRCFEQNAHYQEAIVRFQEYLRVNKRIKPADRADTQKHILDCQDLLARQSVPPAATVAPAAVAIAPQGVPASQPAAAPTVVTITAPLAVAQPMVQTPGEPGSGLRAAGIITASVGGAALVAGILLNLKVNTMASDFQSPNGYTDSKESDRKAYETFGWVSYGVGSACVATGAVLYYLGVRASKNSPTQLAILPAIVSGGAFGVVKGVF